MANVTTLIQFDLHDNDLSGYLPSLTELVKLQNLAVNIGFLSGTFPQDEFIFRLTKLQTLDVGDNDLSGTLPKEIGRLSSLVQLLADDNEIKGTIPETIGQLTRLEVLNLDRNFIRGVLPEAMTKIAGLQRLQMAHNQLSGNKAATIGSVLTQMHSLTTLRASCTTRSPAPRSTRRGSGCASTSTRRG
jgi:Leucine-rich repeat (LRR) protein